MELSLLQQTFEYDIHNMKFIYDFYYSNSIHINLNYSHAMGFFI